MKNPDAIKKSLNACSALECHDAHRDCEYTPSVLCIQNMCGDALTYIKRLEAELIATRVRLFKDGDLCRICKARRAKDCTCDCDECDKAECCCKMCIDTDGKDGFEWDGGTE